MYKNIVEKFDVLGSTIRIVPIKQGHINELHLVETEFKDSVQQYVLRKINSFVFPHPEYVALNAVAVSEHILQKLKLTERNYLQNPVIYFPTYKGDAFYKDCNGNIWTMSNYFNNSFSFEFIENLTIAFKSAKAYGEFVHLLSDFNAEQLHTTVPNFFNFKGRVSVFNTALSENRYDRKQYCIEECSQLSEHSFIADDYERNLNSGNIPLRITHNDTKASNVLFSENAEVIAVIDWDTIMRNTVLYDFADLTRSLLPSMPEDKQPDNNLLLRMEMFEFLVDGYLSGLSGLISSEEVKNLLYGVKAVVYIQAVRFLTDYLQGDEYYKTKYPEHNLIRAKNQLKLLIEIEKNENELLRIIDKIANKFKV